MLLLLLAPCVLLLMQAWGSGIAAPSCSRLRALLTARLAGGISFALMFAFRRRSLVSSLYSAAVAVGRAGSLGRWSNSFFYEWDLAVVYVLALL